MADKLISTRPVYRFAFGREWVACRGSEEIGPRRLFHWQAINDLPPEAEVNGDTKSYACLEPFGARPCFVNDTDLIGYRAPYRPMGCVGASANG